MILRVVSPFTTEAVCHLPDHIHCIWRLPDKDTDYSVRWKEIKRHEAVIWQRRFWEHSIRDETDLNLHLDYIHTNPVKHGVVKNGSKWPWSSFHRYVRMGYYEENWGEMIDKTLEGLKTGE